jgi:hypothetical protein
MLTKLKNLQSSFDSAAFSSHLFTTIDVLQWPGEYNTVQPQYNMDL